MSTALVESIFARLNADTTITGLVSGRIYPQIQPQPVVTPSIVYQVIVDIPLNTLDGCAPGDLYQTRLQTDSYGKTYLQAQALADAVNAVLGSVTSPHFTSVRLTRRDLYEPDTKLHRVSMDFSIWSDL